MKGGDKPVHMSVVFRVFNDGIGFRYLLPEQENLKKFNIMAEMTEFVFAKDMVSWTIPKNFKSYENPYVKQAVSKLPHANTPATFEAKDLAVSIHEAHFTTIQV